MIGWSLIAISLILSAFHSFWWLVLTAILGLWQFQQWHYFKSRPWRRIHYPMMRLYAASAGMETAHAEQQKRDWNIRKALCGLVQMAYPNLSLTDADKFVMREITNFQEKEDLPLIEQYLLGKGTSAEKVRDTLSMIIQIVDRSSNALIVRSVIAGIVEDRFSRTDKAEYFVEVYSGNAK